MSIPQPINLDDVIDGGREEAKAQLIAAFVAAQGTSDPTDAVSSFVDAFLDAALAAINARVVQILQEHGA